MTDAFEMVSRMNPFVRIVFDGLGIHDGWVGDVTLGSLGN